MDERSEVTYRRLPGKGPRRNGLFSGLISRCSLYLGADHILVVDNHGFSEDYKRFYFSDIQAIITRKTGRGAIWTAVLACLLAASLTGVLWAETEPARMFYRGASAIFLILFVINALRGPTCICHIMTAVQEDVLPSLNRLRVARRVTTILRRSIESVQGTLSLEAAYEAGQREGFVRSAVAGRDAQRQRRREREIRHYDGTMHMIAFTLILMDAAFIGIDLFRHAAAITAVTHGLSLLYSVCVIVALTKQYGSDIPRSAQNITWASLGLICFSLISAYILMVMGMMQRAPGKPATFTERELYQALLDISPQGSPFVTAIYICSAVASLAVGASGLIMVIRHRAHSARTLEADHGPVGGSRA